MNFHHKTFIVYFSLDLEVFVVEQNCVYQDIDDKDQYALLYF